MRINNATLSRMNSKLARFNNLAKLKETQQKEKTHSWVAIINNRRVEGPENNGMH